MVSRTKFDDTVKATFKYFAIECFCSEDRPLSELQWYEGLLWNVSSRDDN